jgi:hypothetical protein
MYYSDAKRQVENTQELSISKQPSKEAAKQLKEEF